MHIRIIGRMKARQTLLHSYMVCVDTNQQVIIPPKVHN